MKYPSDTGCFVRVCMNVRIYIHTGNSQSSWYSTVVRAGMGVVVPIPNPNPNPNPRVFLLQRRTWTTTTTVTGVDCASIEYRYSTRRVRFFCICSTVQQQTERPFHYFYVHHAVYLITTRYYIPGMYATFIPWWFRGKEDKQTRRS